MQIVHGIGRRFVRRIGHMKTDPYAKIWIAIPVS
jgi:hypothetical protein